MQIYVFFGNKTRKGRDFSSIPPSPNQIFKTYENVSFTKITKSMPKLSASM